MAQDIQRGMATTTTTKFEYKKGEVTLSFSLNTIAEMQAFIELLKLAQEDVTKVIDERKEE